MNWPWVSRGAFDAVVDERDRLRVQVDGLLDHVRRVDRVEHGLGEVPRPPRPVMTPMPERLQKYIDGVDNPSMRKEMRRVAYRRNASGQSWEQIERDVMTPEGANDGQPQER